MSGRVCVVSVSGKEVGTATTAASGRVSIQASCPLEQSIDFTSCELLIEVEDRSMSSCPRWRALRTRCPRMGTAARYVRHLGRFRAHCWSPSMVTAARGWRCRGLVAANRQQGVASLPLLWPAGGTGRRDARGVPPHGIRQDDRMGRCRLAAPAPAARQPGRCPRRAGAAERNGEKVAIC